MRRADRAGDAGGEPAGRERQLGLFDDLPAAAPVDDRGPPADGSGPSGRLGEAVGEYLTHLASLDRSRHTLRAARLDLGALVRFLADPPLDRVATDDLRRFLADGALRGQPAPHAQQRRTANLKAFFRHARAEGWVALDPAVRLVYAAVDARAPLFLAEDEVDRLVLAAAPSPFWQAAVLALADAGLRRDELLALAVADVHLDRLRPEHGHLMVHPTDRTGKQRPRRLALTPRLDAALRRLLDERDGDGRRLGEPGGGDARAFGEPGVGDARGDGGRLFGVTAAALNAMLASLTSAAGLGRGRRVTPQTLRETFAVGAAGRFVRAEAAAADRGRSEAQLAQLRLEHDVALSELLGLSTDDPANVAQVARRYRRIAG